jgi:hypothetical protein
MTLEEARELSPGDPIEWAPRHGKWKFAVFLEIHPKGKSIKIKTDLGCEVFRKIECVRKKPR